MSLPADPRTRIRLGILFFIPVAFSFIFFFADLVAEHNDKSLNRLEALTLRLGTLRSVASDAELGQHGFLLTNDDRYLLTLQNANQKMRDFDSFRAAEFPAPQPLQRQFANAVRLVRQRLADANQVVNVAKTQGVVAAVELSKAQQPEDMMQHIRSITDGLQIDLGKETREYRRRDVSLTNWTFLFFLFATLVMLVDLVWLYNTFLAHIEAREAANNQLRVLNDQLEQRIEERTRELKVFNEELQQFAYVASHDLQEPLRTITSFTQLLKSRYSGKLDEDADEFIGFIVNSSRRMADLINGLLAMVRLRKSGQPVAPVPFSKLVEDAKVSLQASIRENGAIVEAGDLPSLVVDALQFTQVLQNLISNSIKYRREESPRVRIEAVRDASNWVFSVADNGRGFDPQFSERIFGLFQRLHPREEVDGTGMGLSIARKVVERHGGRMWAESQEGSGAVFYFSLPVSLESRPPQTPALEAVTV